MKSWLVNLWFQYFFLSRMPCTGGSQILRILCSQGILLHIAKLYWAGTPGISTKYVKFFTKNDNFTFSFWNLTFSNCQSSGDFVILFGLLSIYELYSSIWFVAQNWKHCNDWFLSRNFIAKICQCLGILYGGKNNCTEGLFDPKYLWSIIIHC